MKAIIIILALALAGCASTQYHSICRASLPDHYYIVETHKNSMDQVRSRVSLYKADAKGKLKFVRVVR